MRLQRGFIGLPVLMAILLGLVALGGGAYYVIQQNATPQTPVYQDRTPALPATQATTPATPAPTPNTAQTGVQNTNDDILTVGPVSGSAPLSVSFAVRKDVVKRYTIDFGDGTLIAGWELSCGLQFCSKNYAYNAAGTYTAKFLECSLRSDGSCGEGNRIVKTATITVSGAQSDISVPGMNKYTDSDFGFSFWYPSGWSVSTGGNIGAESARTLYKDAVVSDRIRIEGDGNVLYIDKVYSDTRTFNVNPGACGYCGPVTYYYDVDRHQWMKVYPSGTNGGDVPQAVFEAGKIPKPADISNNTMGGLHIFGTEQKESAVIVPLSARNFLFVKDETYTQKCGSACASGVKGGAEFLAKTIVATDPAVATPVSAAQQTATIQAEQSAYTGS